MKIQIAIAFVVGLLFAPVVQVSAQTPTGFALSAGWDLPQTTATRAVAAALARGLCEQAAVDFIAATGQPAANQPAGSWPINRRQLFWYGKGEGCAGKFEVVSAKDGGGDQGYVDGWEISWDSNSWVAGPPSDPRVPFVNGQHPTAWRFVPITPWQGAPASPPPVSIPQPIPQPIPPAPPAPIPTLGADYTVLLQQILASEAALLDAQRQLLDVERDTNGQVHEMNRTIGDTVKSISAFVGKYVLPALAGVWAGTKFGG